MDSFGLDQMALSIRTTCCVGKFSTRFGSPSHHTCHFCGNFVSPPPFQLGPDVPGEQPTPGAAQDESMGFSVRGWKFGACCSHLSTACCVQEGSREPSIDAVTTAVNVVAMKVNEMSQLGPTELFNPPSLGMVSPL